MNTYLTPEEREELEDFRETLDHRFLITLWWKARRLRHHADQFGWTYYEFTMWSMIQGEIARRVCRITYRINTLIDKIKQATSEIKYILQER